MNWNPEAPLPTPLCLRHAALVPPQERNSEFRRRAGVFDQSGQFCDAANIRRGADFELEPTQLESRPSDVLRGRHLYGGQINNHFGHFLCETLARLWPLKDGVDGIESILFLTRRPQPDFELLKWQSEFFDILNLPVPIRVVTSPVTVEELVVPSQGFGIAEQGAGSPQLRAFMAKHFAQDIAPEGPDNLFISREGLTLRKGAAFGEDVLARKLRSAGFESFRPEEHDLRTQISRYRAARKIVSVEGSALHLYGLVGEATQQVAVIARRSDQLATDAIALQIRHFCGVEPVLINAIHREWDIRPGPIRSSKSVAELDLPRLGKALAAAGMVADSRWPAQKADVQERIDKINRRTGRDLQLCK